MDIKKSLAGGVSAIDGRASGITTSKTRALNQMLLKAWRERWTDSQFGINIKTVLPRGVSGDVYNLADCILQQAVVGSDANKLVLSYLRHSLCSHLISHASVLKRISKYTRFENTFCVIALLEFLEATISGVTYRGKPEESVLGNAVLSLACWLAEIYKKAMETSGLNDGLNFEQTEMVERCTNVLEKIVNHQFLMGVIFVAKHEDPDLHADLYATYLEIKNEVLNSSFAADSGKHFEDLLRPIALININHLVVASPNDLSHYESITYCLQPLLAVKVLQNPNGDTKAYVADLQMIQRLKNYSLSRLYFEIIRACLMSLYVSEMNRESIWCAFTFIKVPHIIKELSRQRTSQPFEAEQDFCPDVFAAFEMLLQDPILDFIDTKCACNTIDYLLTELAKQGLVNDEQVKCFSASRLEVNTALSKIDQSNPTPIIRSVICAEIPFTGILKALCADYSKMQEPLLGMFVQVLSGNSLELILSVASVEGKLKLFVSRLINCNENSLQTESDKEKGTPAKASLFDVSFLMLTWIVQTYGSEVVLDGRGNSFFERWVRESMTERNKNKNPMAMVNRCDSAKVDELLMRLNSADGSLSNSHITWQEICLNIPSILYHVLLSWENETISTAEVKSILDRLKSRLCAFSVCAASWLSSYMQMVRDNELLKPLNMVQQLLAPSTPDDLTQKENIAERHLLSAQIIRKMQHDVHPNKKSRSLMFSQNLVSSTPLEEQFVEMWKSTIERGWLPIDSIQTLESLMQSCGPFWLVSKLIDEIMQSKYTKDMLKTMDIVFSLFHLNIEKCTISLLTEWLPMLLMNRLHKFEIIEPHSAILARLCVMCILATMEVQDVNHGQKRRSQHPDTDPAAGKNADGGSVSGADMEMDMDTVGPMLKSRKVDTADHETISSDFVFDLAPPVSRTPPIVMHGPLHHALLNLFKAFAHFVSVDQLSPKIFFISQFLSLLVQLGGEPVKPLLRLMPANLIQNLLKVTVTDEYTTGFILRIYELDTQSGRRKAMADLSLLRNIQLRNESIDV